MVPYIEIPMFEGGIEKVIEAHNNCRGAEKRNPLCLGTLPNITRENVKIIEHLIREWDEQALNKRFFLPETIFEIEAHQDLNADAIINFKTEIRYKGWWLWKKPIYVKLEGDAIKIVYNT